MLKCPNCGRSDRLIVCESRYYPIDPEEGWAREDIDANSTDSIRCDGCDRDVTRFFQWEYESDGYSITPREREG